MDLPRNLYREYGCSDHYVDLPRNLYIEYGCSDHYVDLPRNLADGAVCVCLLIWFVVVLVAKIRLGPDGTAHVL